MAQATDADDGSRQYNARTILQLAEKGDSEWYIEDDGTIQAVLSKPWLGGPEIVVTTYERDRYVHVGLYDDVGGVPGEEALRREFHWNVVHERVFTNADYAEEYARKLATNYNSITETDAEGHLLNDPVESVDEPGYISQVAEEPIILEQVTSDELGRDVIALSRSGKTYGGFIEMLQNVRKGDLPGSVGLSMRDVQCIADAHRDAGRELGAEGHKYAAARHFDRSWELYRQLHKKWAELQ